MRLILFTILLINLAMDCKSHEHFTFPPKFQTPHPGMYSLDKSSLLPPESHTPLPNFQVKNFQNLPFPFLPPSGTKIPTGFPTLLPNMLSSTFVPIKNDDENEDNEDDEKQTTPIPMHLLNKLNRTRYLNQRAVRKEFRPISQNIPNPIDRIDTKYPFQFSSSTEQASSYSPIMTPRSITITDIHRNDQVKAASFPSTQYIPQSSVFLSSTTETSIPILRLSNEMDLDGSFSYEALGADQTHYIQHSRMENLGNGKEEQVVEGSYSYIGSDGKTYTTHYIADSNGFRATGDHLPVPPPMPEIIQRAIQYNLAEEAKNPPHIKSSNDEENELSESERIYRLNHAPPRINHLFTGKTPESFSHNFSKKPGIQNTLITAAFNQTPIQTSIDYKIDQTQNKHNSGTITPQITFLASQGAYNPSANTPQQTIARAFIPEKSTMPQLINYEVNINNSDQENNKALWRWQYGLNSKNNPSNDKSSISRSFGEDDIIINFEEMTPEQYTKMLKKELGPNMHDKNDTLQVMNSKTEDNEYNNQNVNNYNNYLKQEQEKSFIRAAGSPTEKSMIRTQSEDESKTYKHFDYKETQTESSQTSRQKLITQEKFIPPNQIVTKSYDYVDNEYDIRLSKIMNSDAENNYDMNLKVLPLNSGKTFQNNYNNEQEHYENNHKTSVTPNSLLISTVKNKNISDFILHESKDNFKPIVAFIESPLEKNTTAITNLEENIFLKNIFRFKKQDQDSINKIQSENENPIKSIVSQNIDKFPKYIQGQPKIYSDNKNFKMKPVNMTEIFNYITKNQFESNKIKPRPIQSMENYNPKKEINYYNSEYVQNNKDEENLRKWRTYQHNGELRGVIKNYKVLQRNNKADSEERFDRFKGSKKILSQPYLGHAEPTANSYLPPVYV